MMVFAYDFNHQNEAVPADPAFQAFHTPLQLRSSLTIDTRIHYGSETQYILQLRAHHVHMIYGNVTRCWISGCL